MEAVGSCETLATKPTSTRCHHHRIIVHKNWIKSQIIPVWLDYIQQGLFSLTTLPLWKYSFHTTKGCRLLIRAPHRQCFPSFCTHWYCSKPSPLTWNHRLPLLLTMVIYAQGVKIDRNWQCSLIVGNTHTQHRRT
jgi:hypothetical protein